MMRGVVNSRREAVVSLTIHGPAGAVALAEAVIDTGFSGSLAMPAAAVSALGLMRRSGGQAVLADGTATRFDVFAAEVEWAGLRRGVVVSAVGGETPLGMGLLAGHELRIEVAAGGVVEIRPLTPNAAKGPLRLPEP